MHTNFKLRWPRALVSLIAAAAISAALVPAASAQIVPPPTPVTISFATISNLTINGMPITMTAVAPGSNVAITATVHDQHPNDCRGCIVNVPVGFPGAASPAGCLINNRVSPGGVSTRTGTVNMTAPGTPGVYDVVAEYQWTVFCAQFWGTGPSATIAKLVVTGTSGQLCELAKSYSSKRRLAAKLCAKLARYQRASDRGRTTKAKKILCAFEKKVSAKAGKALTLEEADTLILLVSFLEPPSCDTRDEDDADDDDEDDADDDDEDDDDRDEDDDDGDDDDGDDD